MFLRVQRQVAHFDLAFYLIRQTNYYAVPIRQLFKKAAADQNLCRLRWNQCVDGRLCKEAPRQLTRNEADAVVPDSQLGLCAPWRKG